MPLLVQNSYLRFCIPAALFGSGHEVVGLAGVTRELELEEIVRFDDVAQAYIWGAVGLGAAALLNLFEVALARCMLAFADGKGAVGKVDEHLAALQVVARKRLCRIAFRGVGQHQYGEAVFSFERLEAQQQVERTCCGMGIVAKAGKVVDNEHFGLGVDQRIFQRVDYKFLILFEFAGAVTQRVENSPHKVGVKLVVAIFVTVVPSAELLAVELKIKIKYFFRPCSEPETADWFAAADAVANLHGKNGFAGISISKQDAQFVLEPKIIEQPLGVALFGAVLQPFVAGFYQELGLVVVG